MHIPLAPIPKNQKLLSKIDKMLSYYPTINSYQIDDEDFDNLLLSIPSIYREQCKNSIPYKGRAIVRRHFLK